MENEGRVRQGVQELRQLMSHFRLTCSIIFLSALLFLVLVFPVSSISKPQLIEVQNIRHSSNPSYTRVVIDLSGDVRYYHHILEEDAETNIPYRRLYVDIYGSNLSDGLKKKIPINDGLLKSVRTGQYDDKTVRVVLDIESIEDFKIFALSDPFRVVIDVMGKGFGGMPAVVGKAVPKPLPGEFTEEEAELTILLGELTEGKIVPEPLPKELTNEALETSRTVRVAALSESMLGFALWAMIVIIILTVIIFLQIIGIHLFRIIKRRYSERFLNTARPMVMEFVTGASIELPSINRFHLYEFLLFWNNLSDSLRGEMRETLVRLAYDLGLDKAAVKMLKKGNIRKRFMAIATLGHMHDNSAWEDLVLTLSDTNSYLSFATARAMALIDAEAAMELIIPMMTSRSDWTSFNMSGILKAAGVEAISVPLADAALKASPRESLCLLKYLDLISYSSAKRVIIELLDSAEDEDVISACLKALKSPEALDKVRELYSHDCWFIRVQAAAALGRIGTEDDKLLLIEMLSDSEWWVRYRAAKALEKMPFVSAEDVKDLQSDHHDRFSRDILMQAIAERGLK